MTDQSIPNVSPGAVSGLDHTPLHDPLGSPEPDVSGYDEGPATVPAIPEGLHTVEDLHAWVADAEDPDESAARALSVLLTEREADRPRVTLVEPLEWQVLDFLYEHTAVEQDDPQETSEGAPDGPADPSVGEGTGEGGTDPQTASDEGSVEGGDEAAGTGDPLPPIEGTGGAPLDPPQPGADADGFGGDAPEPADPPPSY